MSGVSGCGSLTFTPQLGHIMQSVALTSGGSGYSSAPTVSFTTGTGTAQTDPTASTTLGPPPANAGQITTVIVDSGGTGYNPGTNGAPTVTFTSASGSGATATANLTPVGGTNYYLVGSVTVDSQGYGYTTDPNVTFSGGGGSGAAATATVGRGSNYGKVYLLTAMAQTTTGARAMMQMEVASPPSGYNSTGALTVDGPDPNVGNMPNSNNFYVNGNDANSCGAATPEPTHPAIGSYDDPNANPPTTSTQQLINVADSSPGASHYVGEGGTATVPSVQNAYSSLGDTMGTPTGLKALIDAVNAQKTNVGNTVSLGTALVPAINYISGNLTLSGNNTGYGILVVTGNLVMDGNFSWNGVILVVGNGNFSFSGGGNGQITGTMLVANIWDNSTNQNLLPALGSPTINWNGGGGNGIQYDHCWATNMMSKIVFTAPPSTAPLKVLSVRTLP